MKAVHRSLENEASRGDAELLARIAAGDLAALGDLYDRHAPGLLRFARRIDAQEAEDLLQTTLLRVATLAARFDGRASARPWLFAIMLRVAQERSRSLRRFGAMLKRFSQLPRTAASTVDTAPDIQRALGQLSHAKRTVILLSEVEGFSCDEIAGMLEIPVGTVWTRLHHARRELRAWLGERDR